MKRLLLPLVLLSSACFAQSKPFTVTVVSSESVQQATGYQSTHATSNCVGANCQGDATSFRTKIPVRFMYVVMDGKQIRLHAMQKFMSSYGKTLSPGDYQGEWKNSHTLTIHYSEKEKPKSADYEMAGVW
jgi:hypothetical protein